LLDWLFGRPSTTLDRPNAAVKSGRAEFQTMLVV
jgi:hypothetical protein